MLPEDLNHASIGEWHQVRNAGFRVKAASHAFNENLDAVAGGNETSDQSLQALERAVW